MPGLARPSTEQHQPEPSAVGPRRGRYPHLTPGLPVVDVARHDPRAELEHVGVARVDGRGDPVGVRGTEGLHAGELRDHLAVVVVKRLVELEVVAVAVHEDGLAGKPDDLRAQGGNDLGEAVVLRGLQVVLVVEVRVGLPVDEDALEAEPPGQRVRLVEPVDVGLLALLVFGGHPGDLAGRPGLAVDPGVREVVVGALDVEPDVHDRAGDPAHVLPVLLVAGLAALPLDGQGVPAEALVGRVEHLPLVVQPLQRVEAAGTRAVAAPAVGPVVVAGYHHDRLVQGVEPVPGLTVERVGAGAVAAGLEVAVEDRELDGRVVDVRQQAGVLDAARGAVGHVAEERDRVGVAAVAMVVRRRGLVAEGPAGADGGEHEHGASGKLLHPGHCLTLVCSMDRRRAGRWLCGKQHQTSLRYTFSYPSAMAVRLKCSATWARQSAARSRSAWAIPAVSSPVLSQMTPVVPSTTTSGTEPERSATTGVPHAMASIMTMPNGSGQRIGNSRQAAAAYNSRLPAASTSPTYSVSGPRRGRTACSKYSCSAGWLTLPASLMCRPAARAASMARCAPLSSTNRPTNSTQSSLSSRNG